MTPKLTSPPSIPTPITNTLDNKLFIHLEYHRNGISESQVRLIYDAHCKGIFRDELDITQLTIAYSRPTNLQELLTKGRLHQAPGQEASTFMG